MATALKLKLDIKKLKAAINSKATPKSFLAKLQTQLDRTQNELEQIKKTGKPSKKSTTTTTTKTLSSLQKLIEKKKYKVYQGKGVDLKKDASQPAFSSGRRVSKGLKANQFGDKKSNKGNVYYEYRPNRLDVKQPPKRYPKLKQGGDINDSYKVEVGDEVITIVKNKKEKSGYPVYVRMAGYAPQTVDVYKTKSLAEIKARSLEKKNKMSSGGYMARGGMTPKENLEKELRSLQRELNSNRLRVYKEGDTSDEEMARQKERSVKLKRFNEILELFRESENSNGGMMAKGGKAESESIRKHYINSYPTDELGSDINPKATFDGLYKVLEKGKDAYAYIGVGDSIVRERIFEKLADLKGVDYEVIYTMWLYADSLKGKDLQKVGVATEYVNPKYMADGDYKISKVVKAIRKTRIHPDDVSPNFVNEIANEIGVSLSSKEVVEISDNYGEKYANGGYMAGGGSTSTIKYEIELFFKGLNGDNKKIGKYIVNEKTLDNLEDEWSHIVSIDVIDKSKGEAISFYELKKDLFSKGRQKGFFKEGGYMENGGGISSKTTYVPNGDVSELSLVLNKELKTIKGSDIVDGVYVKNSALSKLKARVAAKKLAAPKKTTGIDDIYSKMVAKAKEYEIEAKDIKENLKKENVKLLVDAGLDLKDLFVIYFGVQTLSPTTDLSYDSSGLMSLYADSVNRYVDRIVSAVKGNKFEIGLKYPNINWSSIIKKYSIQKEPETIKGEVSVYKNIKENKVYAIYKGKNVVLGTTIDRERYVDGKLDKDDYYKRDVPTDGKFEGGYWGLVTSSKEIMYDIAKMILSQKSGYVKDIELFINGLGGIHSQDLDLNKVEYESGGYMENGWETKGKNGYVAFYKDKKIEVYADTKYEAQLKAAKLFNAKKSYDVDVVLAELDGKPYLNSTMMANGGELHRLHGGE
jgi:hypothetical protein